MGETDEQTKVLVLVELCSRERNNHLKKKKKPKITLLKCDLYYGEKEK